MMMMQDHPRHRDQNPFTNTNNNAAASPSTAMGRGLVLGGNMLVFTSVMAACFSSFSPMWLVERTELKTSFCWIGDGIWYTKQVWGQDIKEVGLVCEGETLTTDDAYCNNKLEDEYDGYNEGMCTSTRQAKVLSVLAIVFAVMPLLFILMKQCAVSSGDINRQQKQFIYVVLAALFSLLSACMTVATVGVVMASPMMSTHHRQVLSKDLHGRHYDGYVCAFQTPLYSVFTLLSSAPLKCLMPGPAFSVALMKLIAMGLATFLYGLEAKDIWDKRNAFRSSRVMLASAVNSALGLVPDLHSLPRHYSLFGAASRGFDSYGKLKRHLLVSGLPYLIMILNAGCWALFIYTGVQVMVYVDVSIKSPPKQLANLDDYRYLMWDDAKAADYWAETCQVDPSMPSVPDDMDRYEAHAALKKIVQFLVGNGDRLTLEGVLDEAANYVPVVNDASDGLFGDAYKKWTIIQIYMNIFNFSPITSLKYFWDGGAGLVAVAQFLAVLVLPILKVILWIYLWFVPMQEVIRGRFLSWIDALGKWTLANIYVLVLMGASNVFVTTIKLPWIILPGIIPIGGSLEIIISVTFCEGLGTISFALSNVFSLLIGQATLLSHRYVKAWEEDRRELMLKSWAEEQQNDQNEAYGIRTGSSGYSSSAIDTPFLGEHANNRGSGPSPPPKDSVARGQLQTQQQQQQQDDHSSHDRFKFDANTLLHPAVEAMHDRIHSPYFGRHYRWSPLGKVVIWLFIFFTVGIQLVVQSTALLHVQMKGAIQLIETPGDRSRDLSLLSMTQTLWEIGYKSPNAAISITYFIFTVLFPVAHSVFLALMWTIPLTIKQQSGVFYALEITGAWDALDVFVACILVVYLEADAVVGNMLNLTVPKAAELLVDLGFKKGVAAAELSLMPGFWALVLAVLMQKVLNYFILEQAACALSERRAETKLLEWSQDTSAFSFSPLALRGLSKFRQHLGRRGTEFDEIDQFAAQQTVLERRRSSIQNIGDYMEKVLETSAAGIFSPGNRYMSSIFPKYLYAGFPRWFWTTMFKYGMLEEVNIVVGGSDQNSVKSTQISGNEDEESLIANFVLESGGSSSQAKSDGRGAKKVEVESTDQDESTFQFIGEQ